MKVVRYKDESQKKKKDDRVNSAFCMNSARQERSLNFQNNHADYMNSSGSSKFNEFVI